MDHLLGRVSSAADSGCMRLNQEVEGLCRKRANEAKDLLSVVGRLPFFILA